MKEKTKVWAERATAILRDRVTGNVTAGILASETPVIERLLSEDVLMRPTWESIGKKLQGDQAFSAFLDIVVSVAALYSPAKCEAHREAMRRAVELNEEIADAARKLAGLLELQEALRNRETIGLVVSNVLSNCLAQWPDFAGRQHANHELHARAHLFGTHVLPQVNKIERQFDLKYWPKMSDLLCGMAAAADDGYAESYDPLMLAAMKSRQASALDFLRAFLADLQNPLRGGWGGFNPPAEFRLTNAELAAITNCALGLVDNAYTPEAIKKARQRIEAETGTSRP